MTKSEVFQLCQSLGIPPNYAVDRSLILQSEAREAELIEIGANLEGRAIRLTAEAADAWGQMKSAAAAQNIELIALSGFRSIARQAEIIRAKLAAGQTITEVLRMVAAPGYSEHHTGRALDIGSPDHLSLEEDFEHTTAFRWLERHAMRFGFALSFPRHNPHGIAYEPWHWRHGVLTGRK